MDRPNTSIDYILDFIAERTEQDCGRHLDNFTNLCSIIGIPLAPEKTEGPSQILSFAGIELDTTIMQARLPVKKSKSIYNKSKK